MLRIAQTSALRRGLAWPLALGFDRIRALYFADSPHIPTDRAPHAEVGACASRTERASRAASRAARGSRRLSHKQLEELATETPKRNGCAASPNVNCAIGRPRSPGRASWANEYQGLIISVQKYGFLWSYRGLRGRLLRSTRLRCSGARCM